VIPLYPNGSPGLPRLRMPALLQVGGFVDDELDDLLCMNGLVSSWPWKRLSGTVLSQQLDLLRNRKKT
jgi:hypothetical protein